MKLRLRLLLVLPLFVTSLRADERPNVLLIVSDDHGYADVGFHGSKDIPTPILTDSPGKGSSAPMDTSPIPSAVPLAPAS